MLVPGREALCLSRQHEWRKGAGSGKWELEIATVLLDSTHFILLPVASILIMSNLSCLLLLLLLLLLLCKCQQLIRESEPEASRVSFNVSRCSRMVFVVVAVLLLLVLVLLPLLQVARSPNLSTMMTETSMPLQRVYFCPAPSLCLALSSFA